MSDRTVSLDELVELRTEKVATGKKGFEPYVGLENLGVSGSGLLGWSDASDSISLNSAFEPGDILFGKLRPNLKKCEQVEFSGYCSTELLVLRARPGIDPRFAARVLQSELVFDEAVRSAEGTRMPRTSWNKIQAFRIPWIPLAHQRKIADVLDAADEAIRSTERLIAKLDRVKQGLLRGLLTRGIDKSGNLRDPHLHPANFWDSVLGLIPADWQVVNCDKLCEHIVVGIVVKPTQYYVAEGVPILRSANVREGGIDMSDLKFMSRQSHELLRKSSVRPGDVLTVRTGYPGTSAVVTDDVSDANCVDVIISPPNGAINPNFLALWVNSPLGKDQVLAGQGGLAQQHFNIGQMKKLLVAVPSLEEQCVITEIVSSWEARVHAEIEKLQKLRLIKRGLVDDLLTGRAQMASSA